MRNYTAQFQFQIFILIALTTSLTIGAQVVQTFSFTNSVQSFTVPPCVVTVTADVRGAQGGGTSGALGGNGGRAQAVMTVVPGEVLDIYVGGAGVYTSAVSSGGYNGGGGFTNLYTTTMGGTGGGASDIRRGIGFANRIIVAGGGGGGSNSASQNRAGGNGGGLTGGTGGAWTSWPSSGGLGGTQTAGGAAGVACCQTPSSGSFGLGGMGAGDGAAGCGGGGGWYGGGGGLFGGGGGGSSYLNYPGHTFTSTTAGFNTGNGVVILTYNSNGNGITSSVNPAFICSGANATLGAAGMVSYTWSTGSNASSITVSPASTTAFTVQGTNNTGCVLTSILTVTVNTVPPVISVTSNTTSVCPSQTVVLTASGAITYTWSGGISNGITFTPSATSNYTVTGTNGCGSTNSVVTVTVVPIPVFTSSSPTLICASKTATLSAAGATSYTWLPASVYGASVVVSPSVPTTYTVTGVTGSCSGTATLSLGVDPNPTISISATNSMVCSGSTVGFAASGGINYTWTPGALTGPSVTYSPSTSTLIVCTGDNSFGCTNTSQQVVIVNPTPTLLVYSNKPLVCAGAQASLTVSGANSYSWNTGASGNVTTVNPTITSVYSVTGTYTSTGCASSKTIGVAVFLPTFAVSSSTNICLGTTITLSPGGPYSYTPNGPIVSPSIATIYTVSAISQSLGVNCISSNTIAVGILPLPTITAVCSRTAICKGEKTIITAGGATTYTWSNTVINSTLQVSPNTSTNYTVNGTDANGCINSATIAIKSSACTGIEGLSTIQGKIEIYPNPSKGTFIIKVEGMYFLKLINELGQVIREFETSEWDSGMLEVKDLPSGIYFISAATSTNGYVREKVVVQH